MTADSHWRPYASLTGRKAPSRGRPIWQSPEGPGRPSGRRNLPQLQKTTCRRLRCVPRQVRRIPEGYTLSSVTRKRLAGTTTLALWLAKGFASAPTRVLGSLGCGRYRALSPVAIGLPIEHSLDVVHLGLGGPPMLTMQRTDAEQGGDSRNRDGRSRQEGRIA